MNKSTSAPIKVSVVIPCFNHGEYLMEAVESARASKRPDVEIIVIDDGSSDARTIRVVEELKGENITVVRQPNSGLAKARNAGISLAKGEFILPLDADNRIRPGYIEHGIRILTNNERVGVVYGDAQYFGSRNNRWTVGPFDLHRLLIWNYIDACAIYRKEVWVKNGGYDPNMPIMGLEDWDFWLSTAANGWDFVYVPEVLFDYRVLTKSMLSSTHGHEDAVEDYISRKHAKLHRKVMFGLIKDGDSLPISARNMLSLMGKRLGGLLGKSRSRG